MPMTGAELVTRVTADTRGHDAAIRTSGGHVTKLGVDGEAAGKKLVTAFAGMDRGASGLVMSLGSAVPALGAVALGVGAVVGVLAAAAKAAIDEEVGIKALTASLQANVPGWNGQTAAIEKTVEARQKLSFSDDKLRDSLAELVRHTHDVAQAFDLQNLAMDLARAKNMDLVSASTLVGKVSDGNTSILKRYGIEVAKGATATQALAAMQAQFAGASEGYAASAAGSIDRLKTAFDNAMETVGSALLPTIADLATNLADLIPKVVGVATAITDTMKPAFDAIGFVLGTVGSMLGFFGEVLDAFTGKSNSAAAAAGAGFKAYPDGVKSAQDMVHDALSGIESNVKTHSDTVIALGSPTGVGFGTGVGTGIDSTLGDIDSSATSVYNALDITDDTGNLGDSVGGTYIYGDPGGVTPAIYAGLPDVAAQANNVVGAMDVRVAAGGMGSGVGGAYVYAASSAVNQGMAAIHASVNQQLADMDREARAAMTGAGLQPTTGSGGTVGIGLGIPQLGGHGGINIGGLVGGIIAAAKGAAAGAATGWQRAGNPDEAMYGTPGYNVMPPVPTTAPWGAPPAMPTPEQLTAGQQTSEGIKPKGVSGRGGGAKGGGAGAGSAQSAIEASASIIDKISSAISKGTEELGKLANFTLPAGFEAGVDQFATGIDTVLHKLEGVALKFKAESLAHIQLFAETASAGMELVSKGVDAFAKLKDFVAPTAGAVDAFLDAVQYITNKLGDAAAKWSVEGLAQLKLFSDTTGAAMAMVSSAADALGKLVDFRKPSDLAMQSFVDAVDYLIDKFRSVIAKWDSASLAAAADFGKSVGSFMADMGKAVDALTKLVDFVGPSRDSIDLFFSALDLTAQRVSDRARQWYGLINAGVAEVSGYVGQAVAGMFAAIDGLIKLGDPKSIMPLAGAVTLFFDAFDLVAPQISDRTRQWYGLVNKGVAETAGYVGSAVTGVLAAVDGLTKLAQPGVLMPQAAAINTFFDTLDAFVPLIDERLRRWYGLINQSASDEAGFVGSAVAGVLAAVEPLMKLADFKSPPKEAVAAFWNALSDFLSEFDRRAASFQEQAGKVAADLGTHIGAIMGGIGAAIDPLIKLADFKPIDPATIESFMSSVWVALDQMRKVVEGFPAGFLEQTAKWGGDLNTAFTGIKSALDVIASIGDGTGDNADISGPLGTVLTALQGLIGYVNESVLSTVDAFVGKAGDWNTAVYGMATSTEQAVQRILDALARLPGGTAPPGTPPLPTIDPPDWKAPLHAPGGSNRGGGPTHIYNPVYINGQEIVDANIHKLLTRVRTHRNRRDHGTRAQAGFAR